MKILRLLSLTFALSFAAFLFSLKPAHAATLYWVGNDGANASVASNWKTTNPATCGSGDASAIPGSADTMNFDADCDNGAVIDSSFSSTVDTITISSGYAGTITLANPLTVTTAFSQAAGTFTAGAQTFDINGTYSLTGGIFTASSTNMYVGSTFSITGSPTFNHNSGTLTFDTVLATLGCNNVTFNLVVINASTSSDTKTVSTNCSLPLGNNPTISRVTLRGVLSGTGTLYATAQLNLDSSGNSSTAFSGFSGLIVDSTFTLANSSIHTNLGSYTTVDLNGAFTFSAGTFTAPSGTMTLAGALTVSGGTPTFNANGGTLIFDGSLGSATIGCTKSDASVISFNLVRLSYTAGTKIISSGCVLPLGDSPIIGSITTGSCVLSGTFTGSGTLTVANIFTLNSGAVLSGFSGLIQITNTFTLAGANLDLSDYNPVSFGNFTLSSGTFTAPRGTMRILEGNFTNSGGTFNHNNGTVVLQATVDRTISGSNTFYNLTKTVTLAKSFTFTAGTTQTILGTLTLTGGNGNRLSLRSSTPGQQYYFNVTGGRVLNNLDVQDANGIGNIYVCSSCTDSGNNTNWSFINGSSIQFSLNYPNGNSHITNTNPTYRWSKASVSNNSAVTKYELYIQPKTDTDQNIGTALYIDNIAPFVGDNKKYQYNTTYTLYDDGDYLNLTPSNYVLALGKYNFRIIAHDSAGNIAENSYNFWVDSDIFKSSYSNTKMWFPLQINSISGSNQKGVISSFGLPSTSQNQTTLTISTTTPTIKGIAFSNSTITLTITDQKTKQTKTYTTKAANSRFTLTPTINSSSYLNISVSLDGKYTQLKTLTINK